MGCCGTSKHMELQKKLERLRHPDELASFIDECGEDEAFQDLVKAAQARSEEGIEFECKLLVFGGEYEELLKVALNQHTTVSDAKEAILKRSAFPEETNGPTRRVTLTLPLPVEKVCEDGSDHSEHGERTEWCTLAGRRGRPGRRTALTDGPYSRKVPTLERNCRAGRGQWGRLVGSKWGLHSVRTL